MGIENKFKRVEFPDDPRRCKGVGRDGQCPYEAVSGYEYCTRHGVNTTIEAQEKQEIRNYRLAKWQARVDQFADNPQVKSLREEIGILRMCLEETLLKCNDKDDLFLMSNKISELVTKIERVVTTCHKLEQSTGQTLDKSAALNFAAQIVDIIGNYVSDPQILDSVTSDILKSLGDLSKV